MTIVFKLSPYSVYSKSWLTNGILNNNHHEATIQPCWITLQTIPYHVVSWESVTSSSSVYRQQVASQSGYNYCTTK